MKLLVSTIFGSGSCAAKRAEEQPSIPIVLVDDMGDGDAGCFNPNSKIPTPHIDRLARESMRFTDAHAPGPLCHPSRHGLMTGRYPFRTDVPVWPTQPFIGNGRMMIASLLRDLRRHLRQTAANRCRSRKFQHAARAGRPPTRGPARPRSLRDAGGQRPDDDDPLG